MGLLCEKQGIGRATAKRKATARARAKVKAKAKVEVEVEVEVKARPKRAVAASIRSDSFFQCGTHAGAV